MSLEQITIRAFRAIDDRERCVRYLMEHVRLLDDIGVTSMIRPDISWCKDPDVVVVVAEHAEFGMVAGVRLHKANSGKGLPFEGLVRSFEPDVNAKLNAEFPEGLGKISGLWSAKRFSGRGLPALLTQAGVALAAQIGLRSLVCFAADYSADYARSSGCVPIESLGRRGEFDFPIAGITSHALIVPDLVTLEHAGQTQRRRIFSLRVRPDQRCEEQPRRSPLMVNYQLRLPWIPGASGMVDAQFESFAA